MIQKFFESKKTRLEGEDYPAPPKETKKPSLSPKQPVPQRSSQVNSRGNTGKTVTKSSTGLVSPATLEVTNSKNKMNDDIEIVDQTGDQASQREQQVHRVINLLKYYESRRPEIPFRGEVIGVHKSPEEILIQDGIDPSILKQFSADSFLHLTHDDLSHLYNLLVNSLDNSKTDP